ncbi:hypothetical protein V3F56_02860 [Moorellaceae bacterium AZ2]
MAHLYNYLPRNNKSRGNRQLQVRLPPDHWVWTLDSATRSEEVKKALEFYREYRQLMENISAQLEEIRKMLASGKPQAYEGSLSGEDTRLIDSLDKLLDF